MDFWDEEDNHIDVIMGDIIVVLWEGIENIIEKGGLVIASIRVADKIFDKFPAIIQFEFEAGRFIDELFRFYEAIQPDLITKEFIEILHKIIDNTTSSHKLILKQERYIMPVIHLMDNEDENVLLNITYFLGFIIIEMNQTGQIQPEDELRKVLENNGGLAKLVKIFQNDNFEEKQINQFVAIIIGSLHRAVKIPDDIRSSIIGLIFFTTPLIWFQ
ncbi:MAG: hypothetical protein EZS28_023173 [Streblomastix strix]|uniref:Uncharacterized protein n=1 Tax=Streblomastix strix TaxID=222440 RepID=A0A5J4VFD5_9EUKA|nr:MAG: hypothetical protein EZS28_023173 [Streblomastix strix]